eukprot:scaffold16995_cov127-Isochrysis_galbana.AAC.1
MAILSVGTVGSLTGTINGTPPAVAASGERLDVLANDPAAVGGCTCRLSPVWGGSRSPSKPGTPAPGSIIALGPTP